MLVNLKGKWKWPIAYLKKNKMSSMVLAKLIKTALTLTAQIKLKIISVTCDGEAVNTSALNILGCNIFPDNLEEIINFFIHPTENYNIYIILDACHMLKLGRNALADYGEFEYNRKSIKWIYIVLLHRLQKLLTFKLKNKLSSQCIYWAQNKMKVKYAANTFSASVANAIDFLKQEGLDDFKNSDETVTFIRAVDQLFDFLNSRNPFGKNFKQPITVQNWSYLQKTIKEKLNYLFSLKLKGGKFLKTSGRRTYLYGLAITAKSVLSISENLLFASNPLYKYILTYKFSQDHLELFFAKIRSCNGNNNNPNALQLQYVMRKILLRNNIKLTDNNYNCLELDNDPVGSVFDFVWKKKKKETVLYEENNIESSEDEIISDRNTNIDQNNNIERPHIKHLQQNILYYISGYIVKKLKNINCYHCAKSLMQDGVEHNCKKG